MIVNVLLVYSALMLVGGIMGYVKAGSMMSLGMGILSSILISIGAWQLRQNNLKGFWVVIPTNVVLVIAFLTRFLKTGSFMPSGVLLILSVIVLILTVQAYLKKKG